MANRYLPEHEIRRVSVTGPLWPDPDSPRDKNGAWVVSYLVEALTGARKHVAEQTIRPDTRAALGKDRLGYFEAYWTGYVWRIGNRVDEGSRAGSAWNVDRRNFNTGADARHGGQGRANSPDDQPRYAQSDG